MFSKHSQSLKVLMMLTVSMTVSHLYQNLTSFDKDETVSIIKDFKTLAMF